MGIYASVLKTKLIPSNPQDKEVATYNAPPENRKRRAIILNTEKGDKPTVSTSVVNNKRLEEKTKEEGKGYTDFRNKFKHKMAEFKRKMQEDFQESRK
eukprot:3511654-Ditylum_brightwellii.AAC.1